MGLQRIEEVKKRKPFAPLDFIVYFLLAVLVLLLFLLFVIPTGDPLRGIAVTYGDDKIASYSFDGGWEVSDGWQKKIAIKQEGDIFTVTVTLGEGEYNVFSIDEQEKTVKMIEANCSIHADCTYMEEIRASGNTIVCVPHGLKILPLDGEQDYSKPSLG